MIQIAALLMPIAPLIAETLAGTGGGELAYHSLIASVLGWFMLRADRLLTGIKHEMRGLNRTQLIEILSRPTTSPRARTEARRALKEVAPDLAEEFSDE